MDAPPCGAKIGPAVETPVAQLVAPRAGGLVAAFGAAVAVLAPALDALVRGGARPAGAYSGTCLERVWRSTHFSWWMTTMLHRPPGADPFDLRLQRSQLRYVTTSEAQARALAENYVGIDHV